MTVQAMAMARLGLLQIHEDRALAEKCIARAAPYLPEMAHLIATMLRARKDDERADGYLWLAVISKCRPSATFELAASLQKDSKTQNLALDLLKYAAEQGHKAAEEARIKLRATIRLNLWAEKPPPPPKLTLSEKHKRAQMEEHAQSPGPGRDEDISPAETSARYAAPDQAPLFQAGQHPTPTVLKLIR
jgi:hypothetical protein